MAVGLVLTLGGTACKGGDDKGGGDGGGGGDDAGAVDDLREKFQPLVEAECGWLFDCCTSGERDYRLGPATPDQAACVERTFDLIEAGTYSPIPGGEFDLRVVRLLNYIAYDLDRGRIDIDDDALEACIAERAGRNCNAIPDTSGDRCVPPPPPMTGDACRPELILVGTQKRGQDCNLGSLECEPGTVCSGVGSESVCVPGIADGGTCFEDYHCPAPLLCDYATGTCTAGAAAGESCTFADPDNPVSGTEVQRCGEGLQCDPTSNKCVGYECAYGSSCDDDGMCPSGLFCVRYECGPKAEIGDECYNHDDCADGVCDWNANVCAAPLPNGSLCQGSEFCMSDYCGYDTTLGTNVCMPGVGTGQSCLSYDDDECTDGWCDTSLATPTCVAEVGEGGSCVQTRECDSDAELVCAGGSCESVPLPNGSPCGDHSDCESGACFEAMCVAAGGAGDNCSLVGDQPPCGENFYCDAPLDPAMGTCAMRGSTGAACMAANECWAGCTVRYGQQICAQGSPPGEAICDGE